MNNVPWLVLTSMLDEIDYYVPKLADVRLIVRIITFAALEKDKAFFEGEVFRTYCRMIMVCPDEARMHLRWE